MVAVALPQVQGLDHKQEPYSREAGPPLFRHSAAGTYSVEQDDLVPFSVGKSRSPKKV